MSSYYVSKKILYTGEHEVHKSGCEQLPGMENRFYLGEFNSCEEAIKEAKKYYSKVDGCYYCCRECHTEEIS